MKDGEGKRDNQHTCMNYSDSNLNEFLKHMSSDISCSLNIIDPSGLTDTWMHTVYLVFGFSCWSDCEPDGRSWSSRL